MKDNLPIISVLVCNYNYDKYIIECLNSVNKQDYTNIELIIVDDGSTDNSVSIINKFIKDNPDINIKLKLQLSNKGICFSRNSAIDMSTGEYFVFLDSDDTLPEDYVTSFYQIAVNDSADVVYGDVIYFGDQTGKSSEPIYDKEKLMIENYINIASLVKKSSIQNHRFDTKLSNKSHEDYDFWLGLSLMGLKFVKANEVYLNYRIQQKSRNDNTLDPKTRNLAFIDAWEYIIRKYKKKYKISDDIIYAQLRYRIDKLGTELINLNDVVQIELKPELKHREEYINKLQKTIEVLNQQLLKDGDLIQQHQAQLDRILASKDYKVGHMILSNIRKLRIHKLSNLKK